MGKQWEMKWTKKYLPPNTLLKDKYRISAVLGTGSFGITYLGLDTLLEQTVAIKEFFPANMSGRDFAGKNVTVAPDQIKLYEKEKKTFKAEAERIFGLFDVPGICVVKDYFEENNTAYIVEEYMAGGTLKEYLESQNNHMIPWEMCRDIFEPVLIGLCRIHSMGIVHRDISPDNLMFTSDGELKLIDFGAATVKETVEESVKLKENYAPPEQYKNEENIGPWSDIYAICAVMYQALTGNKPVSSFQRIRKDALVKISNYTNIPQTAEEAIAQGLSLDIQKRYFYIGNLMDKLGMSTENVQNLMGKSRAVWGENWLKIITENHTDLQKKKKRLSYKQKRTILGICGGMLVAAAVIIGGVKLYASTHKEEVLNYMAQKTREKNEKLAETPGTVFYPIDSEEYKEIQKTLEPYKDTDYDYGDGYYVYNNIPKELLEKLNLRSDGEYGSGKFALDKEVVENLLAYYYEQNLEVSSESYMGSIRIIENDARKEVTSNAYIDISYSAKNAEGEKVQFSVYYDPIDELVSYISVKGDKEDCKFFLENIFPYFVTETYFTEEEMDKLLARASDSGYITNHAKFQMSFMESGIGDEEAIFVILKPNGYYW